MTPSSRQASVAEHNVILQQCAQSDSCGKCCTGQLELVSSGQNSLKHDGGLDASQGLP